MIAVAPAWAASAANAIAAGRGAGATAGEAGAAAGGGAGAGLDDGAPLAGAEAARLAHRPVRDEPVDAGVEVGGDVALERGFVDRAGRGERGGDGGDDAFEQSHGPIMPPADGTSQGRGGVLAAGRVRAAPR